MSEEEKVDIGSGYIVPRTLLNCIDEARSELGIPLPPDAIKRITEGCQTQAGIVSQAILYLGRRDERLKKG